MMILSLLQSNILESNLFISDKEINNFLISPYGRDVIGEEYKVMHILIPLNRSFTEFELNESKKKAQLIIKKISSGESISEIILDSSDDDDPLRINKLKWSTLGKLPSLFARHITTMNIGDISLPIISESGIHIIKLLNKRIYNNYVKQKNNNKNLYIRAIITKKINDTDRDVLIDKIQHINKIVKDGGNFWDIALNCSKENSPYIVANDIGWISKDGLYSDLYIKIKDYPDGYISDVIQTSNNCFCIVQVLGRRSPTDHNYDTLDREEIKKFIYNKKLIELREIWIKKIVDDSYITVCMKV